MICYVSSFPVSLFTDEMHPNSINFHAYFHKLVCTHVHTTGMDDSSVEVRDLLNALMDKSISAEEQGIDKAGDREISMALFGTKKIVSDVELFVLDIFPYRRVLLKSLKTLFKISSASLYVVFFTVPLTMSFYPIRPYSFSSHALL